MTGVQTQTTYRASYKMRSFFTRYFLYHFYMYYLSFSNLLKKSIVHGYNTTYIRIAIFNRIIFNIHFDE